MNLPALICDEMRALGREVDEDSVCIDSVTGTPEGLHVKARVREAIRAEDIQIRITSVV